MLVPIIVRPAGDREDGTYELIAGERRWRAAAAARLATIPAIVRPPTIARSLELAVVENLQREDLDPLEEAMGFSHLIDEYDYTQERLAERLGKSRPAVANALAAARALDDAIKAHVRRGRSRQATRGRCWRSPRSRARRRSPSAPFARGLSVREIERLASRARAAPLRDGPRATIRTSRAPRAGCAIGSGPRSPSCPAARGGRIEIRYSDDADLARIVDVILPEDA